MKFKRLSMVRVCFLTLLFLMLGSLALNPGAASVEAAPRPTREGRPTRPPRSTPTPAASPTIPADPTPTPFATATPPPTATPGDGSGHPGNWNIVGSPNVNGRNNALNTITAVSPQDLWAVGEHRSSNGSSVQTLTMRWNGASWNIVSSPNPDPGRNSLLGVDAVSTNDVWAVGVQAGTTGPNWASLILHWDGNTWSNVAAPDLGSPGTSELRDVAALSSSDVWAVGNASSPATGWWDQPLAFHWDGSNWSSVPVPAFGTTSQLNAVTAVAPNDVWAVGTTLDSNWKTLVLHWDGSSWTRVNSPNLGNVGNYLYDIEALSANEIWAVGAADNGGSTLAMRWNGASWSIVPTPNGTERPGVNRSSLTSLSAISPNNVWAVGIQASSTIGSAGQPIYMGYALIHHWNGSTWSEVSSAELPSATAEDGALNGVVATGTNDVWAVGSYYEATFSVQAVRTLIERYTAP
ncbi:MAG: hypothetical protein CL608_24890 [Anaerolineaceae bacterium]|nr:hypothetical protein [Anaerolineaceae bacterium]